MSHFSRRDFLQFGLASFGAAAPFGAPLLRWLPRGEDRCLVVIELLGGNDGLNTLIPLDDGDYRRARPSLSSVAGDARKIADGYGLHGSMTELAALFENGHAAAVHGVGYPNPDRSHFRSRDIWHAADPSLERVANDTTGWLGRAADWISTQGIDVPAIGLGGVEVPLALQGANVIAPVLQRIEDYSLLVGRRGDAKQQAAERADLTELVTADEGVGGGELEDFVRDVARAGVGHAERLQRALAAYRAGAEYPGGEFGRAMQMAARVLVSGFGTRICHVPLDGFDTHARQAPTHAGLLRQLSLGIGALHADLAGHGKLEQTVVFVHSEFGRRVAENQSQGTDHGAAAPVFVVGGGVQGGLLGTPPSLTDLDDGDLRATTDFRAVYRELVEWLGVPADRVLAEREFARIGLWRR